MLRRLIISIMVFGMLSAAVAGTARCEEDVWSDEGGWESTSAAPMHLRLDPVIELYLGFRAVELIDSRRADEYGFMHSRPVGGFFMHHYPLPHRYDIEFDFVDEKDMSAEFSYMYKDIIVLNYHMRGLWHNIGHEQFPEMEATSIDWAPGVDYGVSVTDNKVYLRLKWPDNPYHMFASFRDFNKEGDIQQRYMVGRFGRGMTMNKNAQTRHINWNTRTFTAGANGHFGPVELEYIHAIKDFDASYETELRDNYQAYNSSDDAFDRAEGVFRHNAVPDLLRTSDTIKLHTSYTGRIVGTVTYYHNDKTSSLNTAQVEANRMTTAWTFIPIEGMAVSVRYRYDRTEILNQSTASDFNFTTGLSERMLPLHRSVSYDKHVGDAIIKYSPIKGVNFRASYRFEHLDKEHIYDWHNMSELGLSSPNTSQRHTAKLFAWLRPVSMVDVKLGGEYSYCTDPAYLVDYKNRYAANAKIGVTPIPELSMSAYYKLSREKNPVDYPGQTNDRKRSMLKDTAGVTFVYMPAPWFSTSAFYNYDRSVTKTSIKWEPTDFFVELVTPMRDTSHVYGITATTAFDFPVNLDLEFHQCISRSRYFTTATASGPDRNDVIHDYEVLDMDDMVNLRLHETGGRATAMLALPMGFGVDLTYEVNHFDDRENNPQYLALDGTVHSGTMMVRKKW